MTSGIFRIVVYLIIYILPIMYLLLYLLFLFDCDVLSCGFKLFELLLICDFSATFTQKYNKIYCVITRVAQQISTRFACRPFNSKI